MAGFWDYFNQQAQMSNEKANQLYARQMQLAQMMASMQQQDTSTAVDMSKMNQDALFNRAGLFDSMYRTAEDNTLSRDKMAQDATLTREGLAVSRQNNANDVAARLKQAEAELGWQKEEGLGKLMMLLIANGYPIGGRNNNTVTPPPAAPSTPQSDEALLMRLYNKLVGRK